MNDLKWFFPESSSDCLRLFNDGYRPHGGGTFLIKTSLNVKGLFDLSGVREYKETAISGDTCSIGAATTYFDAASCLEREVPGNYISKALFSAASTPLRNRITIGGSIYSMPKWSDLAAPLAASDAMILFENSDKMKLTDYLLDQKNKRQKLVSSVSIPVGNISGSYKRFTLSRFDYPFFTIAVSNRADSGFKAAVSGTVNRIMIFSGSADSIMKAAGEELSFNDERGLSGNYICIRALTELERLLSSKGADNG